MIKIIKQLKYLTGVLFFKDLIAVKKRREIN